MKIKDIKDKKLKKQLKKIMKYGNKIGFILQKNYPTANWRLMLDEMSLREIMRAITELTIVYKKRAEIDKKNI